jgi:2-dehydro-3-deoxy-D-arabinonate dehydratase
MSGAPPGSRLVRVRHESGQVSVGAIAGDELRLLATGDLLMTLEDGELADVVESVRLRDPEACEPPEPWALLVPLKPPETWAAGVTYERSRAARMHESRGLDVYDLVYEATRPELFLKDSAGRRTVGPGESIATRSDSEWTVPEPEIALVLGADGKPLGVTIGNDVSSRDIEGANPLYLPQAKIYARCCALGPAVLVPLDWSTPLEIEMRILDSGGEPAFEGSTSTANMRRSFDELIEFLCRDNPVPRGTVLLTGTGIVPPDDFTLRPGQLVEIHVPGLGTLRNAVGEPQ